MLVFYNHNSVPIILIIILLVIFFHAKYCSLTETIKQTELDKIHHTT